MASDQDGTGVGGTIGVLLDVQRERMAQDRKWGPLPENMHPDADPAVAPRDVANHFSLDERIARETCQSRSAAGKVTFSDILVEEVAEALAAAAELVHRPAPASADEDLAVAERTVALRAELVQVAAVAVKWAEVIDARA